MSPREQIHAVLRLPWERPLRAASARALAAVPAALLVLLEQYISGFFSEASLWSFLLAGAAVSYALWGADRLWMSTLAPHLGRPFSLWAYATRIPFWYVAGGIALESSLLALQGAGLAELYGVPAAALFDAGSRVGIAVGVLWHAATVAPVRRALAGAASSTTHTQGPSHHDRR